jgi:hypothetical protein
MELSAKQLDTLRHMLGINDPWKSQPVSYRDYYCASPGDETMHELLRLGAVRIYSRCREYEWFETTAEGWDAALNSFTEFQKSIEERFYCAFLGACEVRPDLSIAEFKEEFMRNETHEQAN